jgi:molybdopterin-binding protein
MEGELGMELSARNQPKGTVTSVEVGAIMAAVVMGIGGQETVATITRYSVERLRLARATL